MRTRRFVGAGVAFALAAILAYVTFATARPYGPWGMMGGGYGPGMMGRGYGPGMMGGPWMMGLGMTGGYGMMPWGAGRGGDLKLTTDDVKARFERWLAWHANPRLKIGAIKEKDADTIEVDIVTQDNSLVQRFNVDRRTGFFRPEG
jgi:hypothetical protein